MRRLSLISALLALGACDTSLSTVSRNATPNLYTPAPLAPADAAEGTCWDRTESPALVQTITETVLVQPAQISATGTVQAPPVYRTVDKQVIVQERQIRWFQIPCPQDLTPSFVASVQRALALRGLYEGEDTGQMDKTTRKAIETFQLTNHVSALDHSWLTVERAQKLGLWTVDVPPPPA